ncbi:MAG: RDD family protein [Candidatus Limnocylindrales bacterium]
MATTVVPGAPWVRREWAMVENDPAEAADTSMPPAQGLASAWGSPPGLPPPDPLRPGFGLGAHAYPGPVPGLKWGGVRERFLALLIDLFIVVGIPFAIFMGVVVPFVAFTSPTEDVPVRAFYAIFLSWVVWWVFALIYHPTCWYFFEGTPGQRMIGLRVVRASDGRSLGVVAVLVRYVIFSFVTILVPLGIVSGFVTANDPSKRAWHDELAQSVVVQRL